MTEILERRDTKRKLNDLALSTKLTAKPTSDDVDYTDYRSEAARLGSFVNWRIPHMNPKNLAAAGFYYTGETDRVRCFECGLVTYHWEEGDNPWTQHQRWSGNCRFIRDIPCGNVPIGVDPSTIPDYEKSRDVCGIYEGCPILDHSIKILLANTKIPRMVEVRELQASKHTEYINYDDRVNSFKTWPKIMPQTRERMAAAGFFYTGKSDRVICYYCGGGLGGWESTDEPLREHAKWFPKCKHVIKALQEEQRFEKSADEHIVSQCSTPSHM